MRGKNGCARERCAGEYLLARGLEVGLYLALDLYHRNTHDKKRSRGTAKGSEKVLRAGSMKGVMRAGP